MNDYRYREMTSSPPVPKLNGEALEAVNKQLLEACSGETDQLQVRHDAVHGEGRSLQVVCM